MLPKTYGQTKPPLGEKINFAHPLAKGLVGMWLFNEGNGGKAYDLSGNNNTGTLTNMAIPSTTTSGWNPCKFGKGLAFDGTDDYVNCGDGASLNPTSAITVEAWVKPTTTGDYETILAKGVWDTKGYWIAVKNDGSVLWYIYGVNNWVISGATQLYDGNWHYVVFSYDKDGGTNNHKFYIDGVIFSQKTNTGAITAPTANNQFIGRNSDTASKFKGSIDVVRIYNRALTAGEIQKLYMSPFCMFEKMLYNKKI